MQHRNLRQVMRVMSKSPDWVAQHAGINRRTFFRHMKSGFTPDEQVRLAALFGVDAAWLFAEGKEDGAYAQVAEEVEWTNR